jgi:3D (Asp-Asp-Asp) domain-containing protein
VKLLKKILVAILVILGLLFATCEPEEPEGDMIPYMSDMSHVSAKTKKSDYESLGRYTLTAYCPCRRCSSGTGITATGKKAKAEHTIAADTKVLPYGTKILIDNIEYTVEDCGSGVRGKHIDIFFNSHSEALAFGKQTAIVYKKKSPQKLFKIKLVKISKLKKTTKHHVTMLARKFKKRSWL